MNKLGVNKYNRMVNLSTEESQVTEKSLKLQGFANDIECVKAGMQSLESLNPIIDEVDGWIKSGGLNLFDKMMSYYILKPKPSASGLPLNPAVPSSASNPGAASATLPTSTAPFPNVSTSTD